MRDEGFPFAVYQTLDWGRTFAEKEKQNIINRFFL